ncbi:hypothetical protein BWQ96_09547 [Gracilariopsis chorda]|uniref:Integrase catalytic domain-containing protein n=1 Tax=Gracilariopsis chorda TaxID=448386 RepID=A0A2V3IF69_9FLOR|nr:hypothetical protein BWQ96_09547 [Gracilariopsis chorda]|eukprot:PXF40714.1 hypothetical protein BWQ96_09547 [Gracilariopsis chorda]
MLFDHGSAFGQLFINIAAISNVAVDRTGVEAHSSLAIGEHYHQPLRQTYRKIMAQYNNVEPDYALAASAKAMNDTLGPEGLVPSALVFGEFAQIHTRSEPPDQRETVASRAKVASSARTEMQKHMAKLRLDRALKQKTPAAADRTYQVGDKVLVRREKVVGSRIGEWMGAFTASAIVEAKNIVYIQDERISAAKPFGVAQFKR